MGKQEEFDIDIEAVREAARKSLPNGAVTDDYELDPDVVVAMLQSALSTEIVCDLRYRNHFHMASGMVGEPVAAEFIEHANQEREHASWLAERITQLGGKPDFDPRRAHERSHVKYETGKTLEEMIRIDLIAERVAIVAYREMIKFVADADPTTKDLLVRILKQEEEHADDMLSLLERKGIGADIEVDAQQA